jgi:hypothetical protein
MSWRLPSENPGERLEVRWSGAPLGGVAGGLGLAITVLPAVLMAVLFLQGLRSPERDSNS